MKNETDTTARLDEIEIRDTISRVQSEIAALSALVSTSSGLDMMSIREGVSSWLARWESDLGEVLK